MNAISQMACALAPQQAIHRKQPTNLTKIGAMRSALKEGPKTSAELAAVAGVRPALTVALLKTDIKNGRVNRNGTRYELSANYEHEIEAKLNAAVALLRRYGYAIVAPTLLVGQAEVKK